jgi:hypothetical protein
MVAGTRRCGAALGLALEGVNAGHHLSIYIEPSRILKEIQEILAG